MLPNVFLGFLFRIDFLPELIRFRVDAPIDMLAHERHVLVVRFARGIVDSNLLAYVLEDFGIERRLARCQGSTVKTMLLVVR